MIDASLFIEAAAAFGFRSYSGVPCSYLKPLINYVIDSPNLSYVGAANEGDAVAIGVGASLAGSRGVVMLQNSGLGNAVNPLTSLCAISRIPVLLICSWRGEPGGALDEPQHDMMGAITPRLLELMGIRWALFPQEDADIQPTLAQAAHHMDTTGGPYALIMRKDSVKAHALRSAPALRGLSPSPPPPVWPADRPSRREVLSAVQQHAGAAALIATTGYTGRSLYDLSDTERQFYIVGAMGCASSVGLGLALANSRRQIIILDGDGAALMRLGALATIGFQRPRNLTHILLDNESHESTGGQATVSNVTDLAAVAWACGYPRVVRAPSAAAVAQEVRAAAGELTFIHVKVRAGYEANLPRPRVTPVEVAARFRAWFTDGAR